MERFKGPIAVEFEGLPPINLVSAKIDKHLNWFQRVAEATRRRYFTLDRDWHVGLNDVDYAPELNGEITIPKQVNGQTIVYDGASVPLPWLVSFLSVGILRPLGVMLTASIVHDFAFNFGYLQVTRKGEKATHTVAIERHHADRLFRDIISTVNGLGYVGWIAWFFVRLGWFFSIKYNGHCRGGRPPVGVAIVSVMSVIAFGYYLFRGEGSVWEQFEFLITVLAITYFVFYVITVFLLKYRDSG